MRLPHWRPIRVVLGRQRLVASVTAPVGLAALVVLSSFETVKAEVGPVSVRPVHLAAVLIALWLWRRGGVNEPALTRAVLIGCAGILGVAVVPMLTHRDTARLALPGLLVVNVLLAYVSAITYRAAVLSSARRAVGAALAVIVAVPLLQALVGMIGAGPQYRDARLLGLGRAPGTFEEATWAGAASAFAGCWFLSVRQTSTRILAIAAAVGTLLAASRTALLSFVVVIAITMITSGDVPLIGIKVSLIARHRRRANRLAATIFGVVVCAALLFTPWSLSAPIPALDYTSVDSRLLDSHAIVDQQTGLQVLVGSDATRIYDAHRSRLIPSSSNNAIVDFYWKQGLFGLMTLAWLSILVVWILPRAAGIRLPFWRYPPPLLVIVMTLAMSVANNAVLRPWFWVFLGVSIAAISYRGEQGEPVR